ncbi:MAG: UbiA prenyltransferase family protein [Nitrospirae bacterium]|nr:UbiA prenyltransferase family protein [Nitrospirota bacterium]
MTNYIKLLRPHQYLKNLFIFMPLFFGLKITDMHLFFNTLISFVSFSLVASSIYIFNDYHDIADDRNHPAKKNRPLASGKVSKKSAVVLMAVFWAAGFGISFIPGSGVSLLILLYVAMNIAYTLKLKHIAIIDIFIIATGFIIRLFVGSQSGSVSLSMWIIVITFLLALFLALAKRRDDLILYLESGHKARKVIEGYNVEFLNSAMVVMASVVIVSYIMYTISADVVAKMHSNRLYFTVVFVIMGLMRYMQQTLVLKNSSSPTEVLMKDRFLQLVIAGWLLTFMLLIY